MTTPEFIAWLRKLPEVQWEMDGQTHEGVVSCVVSHVEDVQGELCQIVESVWVRSICFGGIERFTWHAALHLKPREKRT